MGVEIYNYNIDGQSLATSQLISYLKGLSYQLSSTVAYACNNIKECLTPYKVEAATVWTQSRKINYGTLTFFQNAIVPFT
uniref:Uncharacterized protein n=1 Tax=Pyxicephalus adspersus TaxID=30357 RepID=A0AAV3A5T0_PYXAD|nr:TPA: hypothetical protein GDO54_002798 [Pyxicephalus adspersus]